MSYTYKDNTDEVLKALSGPNGAIPRGLEAIGLAAEGYAKKNLYPGHGFDTGNLRNRTSHAVEGDAAYIGTNVEYAPYVELGARGRKGIHYLQQAASEHANEYKQLMEDSMKNA
jgi:phage gpG-like protein